MVLINYPLFLKSFIDIAKPINRNCCGEIEKKEHAKTKTEVKRSGVYGERHKILPGYFEVICYPFIANIGL